MSHALHLSAQQPHACYLVFPAIRASVRDSHTTVIRCTAPRFTSIPWVFLYSPCALISNTAMFGLQVSNPLRLWNLNAGHLCEHLSLSEYNKEKGDTSHSNTV